MICDLVAFLWFCGKTESRERQRQEQGFQIHFVVISVSQGEIIFFYSVKVQRFGQEGKDETVFGDVLKESKSQNIYQVSCLSKYMQNYIFH